MRGRYGRLPSMQSMVGFESAARLNSFSRAADELAMTQSAVSHQIRSLEEHVGQALFRRQGRSVELTDAGRDLLETTRRTLSTLSTGLSRLDFYVKTGSVVITCPSAWARHWLLPRLPDLRLKYPDIDPWIATAETEVDFEHTESDCYVALGDGHWPGLNCVKLAPEYLSPVCSPAYKKRVGKKLTLKKLPELELLHDEDWAGWNRWFQEAGLATPAPVRGFNYSDPGLALDCALDGQGIALASMTLAARALAEKSLLRLFSEEIDSGLSWYLVGDPSRLSGDAESQFWDWMVEQINL